MNQRLVETEVEMPAVCFQLSALTKAYNRRQVLAIDELEIRRGEIFALVGPSGSGKSTLLRLLNFLEPPTSGTIRFAGVSVNGHDEAPLPVRQRITTVAQRPILLNRSVLANVEFGLRLRGFRDRRDYVHEALDAVGMASLAHHQARTLSGGEAQRVALARAMVIRPQVLLLDEPTANLDPYNVGVIEQTVRRLNGEHEMTVVLVTHNVFQARRLANRVALILDGKLVEVADTNEFFEQPRDARTSAFVRGDMIY